MAVFWRSTGRCLSRCAVVIAITLAPLAVSSVGPAGAVPLLEPAFDEFYAPPAGFELTAPGSILRTRPVDVNLFGIPIPIRSTQVLFRTSDTHGNPVTTVTTVMTPDVPWTQGNRPLLGYSVAIDSLGDECNPSYTLRRGNQVEMALFAPLLQKGYVVAITDYEGPRNAYGAGRMAAHATLDGLRAASQLPGAGLAGADTPMALWGYSGGAIATGWAAQLQPTYAPELNLKAVAAGGTPADMKATGRRMDGTFMSSIFLMGVVGVSREYPDLDVFRELLNPEGRRVEYRLSDACTDEGAVAYPFRRFAEFTTVPDPLGDPRLNSIFDELRMGALGPTAPVYLYHSTQDEGIPFEAAERLRRDWCAQGTPVWFRADDRSEHVSLAISEAPAVVGFLEDRIAGRPAPNNC